MDSFIAGFLPTYLDLAADVVSLGVKMLVGGVLLPFLGWAIGYAVFSVYTWVSSWTR